MVGKCIWIKQRVLNLKELEWIMELGHGILFSRASRTEQWKREKECLVIVYIQTSQPVCRLRVILDALYESKPTRRLRNLPTFFTARKRWSQDSNSSLPVSKSCVLEPLHCAVSSNFRPLHFLWKTVNQLYLQIDFSAPCCCVNQNRHLTDTDSRSLGTIGSVSSYMWIYPSSEVVNTLIPWI